MVRVLLILCLIVSCTDSHNKQSQTSAPTDIYNPNTTQQITDIQTQLKIHEDLLELQSTLNNKTNERLDAIESAIEEITSEILQIQNTITNLQQQSTTNQNDIQTLQQQNAQLLSELTTLQSKETSLENSYTQVDQLIQTMSNDIETLRETFRDPSFIISTVNSNINQITNITILNQNIATIQNILQQNNIFTAIPSCGHGFVALYDASGNILNLLVTEVKGQTGNIAGVWQLQQNQTVNLLINGTVTCSNVVWSGKVLKYKVTGDTRTYIISLNY